MEVWSVLGIRTGVVGPLGPDRDHAMGESEGEGDLRLKTFPFSSNKQKYKGR